MRKQLDRIKVSKLDHCSSTDVINYLSAPFYCLFVQLTSAFYFIFKEQKTIFKFPNSGRLSASNSQMIFFRVKLLMNM